MEVLETVSTYSVYVSENDVVSFAENCPGFPAQSVVFEFDKLTDDLIGMHGITIDIFNNGYNYRPLAENARKFAKEKLWLR